MHEYDTNSINALDWLDKNPRTANLIVTARELIAVQNLIKQLIPGQLAKYVQVAYADGQQIAVIVPGPAYASRLKQMSNSLIRQLNQHGWSINKIIVQIDAHMSTTATETPRRKTNFLDSTSLNEFARLEQSLSTSPLTEAIQRLLRHHS